jgi:hypothetical protein
MSRRIPDGMDRSELFPNHKSRPRAKEYNMTMLASELEDWAAHTKSVNFCDFTRPRRITYSKIKAEAGRNPHVQDALLLVKDSLTDNLRKFWLDNPHMKDYVKSYLDCFDEILQERKAQLVEQVTKHIESRTTLKLSDSTGYLTEVDNE